MPAGHTDSFAVVLRTTDCAIENSALVFRIGEKAKKIQLTPEIEFVLSRLITLALAANTISTVNKTVWPSEVNFLFEQIRAANKLPEHLQHKLRHHINRLKLEGLPEAEIIQTATTLTAAMGAMA